VVVLLFLGWEVFFGSKKQAIDRVRLGLKNSLKNIVDWHFLLLVSPRYSQHIVGLGKKTYRDSKK